VEFAQRDGLRVGQAINIMRRETDRDDAEMRAALDRLQTHPKNW
jgi:hypothetical protein